MPQVYTYIITYDSILFIYLFVEFIIFIYFNLYYLSTYREHFDAQHVEDAFYFFVIIVYLVFYLVNYKLYIFYYVSTSVISLIKSPNGQHARPLMKETKYNQVEFAMEVEFIMMLSLSWLIQTWLKRKLEGLFGEIEH
jgi:hypothetical protein